MKIARIDQQTVALQGLNQLFCELLQSIVPAADPGQSEAARERLFSAPTSGGEPEFESDWREYVVPDLRAYFRTSLEMVAEDLRPLPAKPGRKVVDLQIPVARLESWINALNQARLALASTHGLSEEEMDGRPSLETPRDYAIFQIYFYGFLQECFLQELEG